MVEDVKKKINVKEVKEDIVSVAMSDFPLWCWVEWNQDCKGRYNDRRWLKAWSDHKDAQLWRSKVNIEVNKEVQQVVEPKKGKPVETLLSGEEIEGEEDG